MYKFALTRKPGPDFKHGITTVNQASPSYDLMISQHERYIETLRGIGLTVEVLDPLIGFPDSYFVEDAAIVTPQIAVITNPGAPARRGEAGFIEPALAKYLPTARISSPGTIDGGDVLIIADQVFIGISERTNQDGANQLTGILSTFDYKSTFIPVESGLHLKSSVNYVGKNTLLLSSQYAERPEFKDFFQIVIDEDESYAANTLWVNDFLIMPAGYPKTRQNLAELELPIHVIDVSEARKMDGGLTCMSLRL